MLVPVVLVPKSGQDAARDAHKEEQRELEHDDRVDTLLHVDRLEGGSVAFIITLTVPVYTATP